MATPSSEAEDQKLRTAGVFSRASATYDQVGPPFFARFGRRLVELAHIPHGSAVLDVACGRGASLLSAAEQIGPTGSAIGIDLAEGMIGQLESDIRRRALPNVDVLLMDAENLRFPDSSFDFVLCGFCLFFFPNLQRALSEIHRVLKPRGRLASSTWGKTPDQWQWLDKLVESFLPEPPSSSQDTEPPGPDFETPQGMQSIIHHAGFAHIDTVAETRTFTYASEEQWWSTMWSHGMRGRLEKIEDFQGADGLAKFKAKAFEAIQQLKDSTGIHEPFPVLYTVASKP